MSAGQITGTFASNNNKYDDGEANYKLPLFNYEEWSLDTNVWLRGICGYLNGGAVGVFCINNYGSIDRAEGDSSKYGICPLIYIR